MVDESMQIRRILRFFFLSNEDLIFDVYHKGKNQKVI